MRYISDGAFMKAMEQYTINDVKIPSTVLMERAALSVRDTVMSVCLKNDRVIIVCGIGNNGADGLATARLMYEKGILCDVYIVGNVERATDEWKMQHEILENMAHGGFDIRFVTSPDFREYNIIVDAIFGIGLKRDVEGIFKSVIEEINSVSQAYGNKTVIAVDIPSGIDSTTGHMMGAAVKASVTVTFGCEKTGTMIFPGKNFAGRVIITDVGILMRDGDGKSPKIYTHDTGDYELLPKRDAYSNKGSYGKLLVIAGSKNMTGAALFCAQSAYRCGTGLVSVFTVSSQVKNIIQNKVPEAVIVEGSADILRTPGIIKKRAQISDAVVCGPGLGTDRAARDIVKEVLSIEDKTVILDADALNIIAENKWQNLIKSNMVITPHLGEMSRLTGKSIEIIRDSLMETACEFAGMTKAVVILKDAVTVIADEYGVFYLNSSGNSGMATAGSGDILSGIVGAMFAQAQVQPSFEKRLAASLAVYVHGLAGDYAKKQKGERPMLSRDILKSVEKVMGEDLWKTLI